MNFNVGAVKFNCPGHKHDFHEIIICTEGSGFLQLKDERIAFKVGTVGIIPPKVYHYTASDIEFERVFIDGSFEQFLNLSRPTVIQCGDDGDGVVLAKLIYRNQYNNKEYLSSLVHSFMNYIIKAIEIDDEISLAINAITNEIIDNFYDCKINLKQILKKSGYAEDYIRAKFKEKTGKTPVKFLTDIRINHACVLIDMYKRSMPLSDIAERCGYTDYVYFSRRFKEIVGVSARKYISLESKRV